MAIHKGSEGTVKVGSNAIANIRSYREMGQKFCVTLRDYASNETKVREAI